MGAGLDNPDGQLYRREDPATIRSYRDAVAAIEQNEPVLNDVVETVPDRLVYHLVGASLADDAIDDEAGEIAIEDDLYDQLLDDMDRQADRAAHRDRPILGHMLTAADYTYRKGYDTAGELDSDDIGELQDAIYDAQHSKNRLTAGGVLGGLGTGLTAMLGLAAAGATTAVPVAGLGLIYGGRKAGIEAWKYFRGRQERLEDMYSAAEVDTLLEEYGDYTITIDHPGTSDSQPGPEERLAQENPTTDGASVDQDEIVEAIDELGGDLPDRFMD